MSESTPTFAELGVSQEIINALAARGITSPFKIQSLVIGDAMEGHDVLAKAPTGSGKTLAFGIPIVERVYPDDPAPAAIVLVPTRELAAQVTEETAAIAKAHHLRIAAVYGGIQISKQADAAHGAHVLVATPGRLEDLISRRMISVKDVHLLVLDEADRMLDMGFQPQVDKIVRRIPTDRQTMFFSATLDGEVGRLARSYTQSPRKHEAEPRPEMVSGQLEHRFELLSSIGKVDRLAQILAEPGRNLALIFVRTKPGADRLAQRLKKAGVQAAAMHGDMQQSAREKTLSRFEDGTITVLVATDVAARGLDLDNITHVINYDPPEDDKAYTHRVGRTARAGRSGTAITLLTQDQVVEMSRLAMRLGLQEQFESAGLTISAQRSVYTTKGRQSPFSPNKKTRRRF